MTDADKRLVLEVIRATKDLFSTLPPLAMLPTLTPKVLRLKEATEALGKAALEK